MSMRRQRPQHCNADLVDNASVDSSQFQRALCASSQTWATASRVFHDYTRLQCFQRSEQPYRKHHTKVMCTSAFRFTIWINSPIHITWIDSFSQKNRLFDSTFKSAVCVSYPVFVSPHFSYLVFTLFRVSRLYNIQHYTLHPAQCNIESALKWLSYWQTTMTQ